MAGDLLHNLCTVLDKSRSFAAKGGKIQDWRITLYRTQILTLGIKNNVGGSVYTPPAYKSSENAEIFLIWEDGKCSRATVPGPPEGEYYDWDKQLILWRMAAFVDPYTKRIPGPAKLPDVKIQAEEIRNLVENDLSYGFEQQRRILSDSPQEAQTGANIMALWGRNHIQTSTGIDVAYKESKYAVSWSFDSQISEGFAKRRLITEQEWEDLWQNSISRYHLIKKQGESVNENTLVILAPSVVGRMVEQYILPNFRGGNILEGQSRFRVENFTEKERLFDGGLTLEINPLRPYHWASYLLTSEGVPALSTVLVAKGFLQSPYLNVKDAYRWSVDGSTASAAVPTGIPAGASGIIVQHVNQVDWLEMLERVEDGILILSVLGLHTQNPVTGDFSLAAPSALRISGGRLTGKTSVRIDGNIWDIFKSPETRYGRAESDRHPYLLVRCQVDNL